MRPLVCLLTLFAACFTPIVASEPPPKVETWYLVYDREALVGAIQALGKSWSPEEVVVRSTKQLYHIFRPWNIVLLPCWEKPASPGESNFIPIRSGGPGKVLLGLVGEAPYIDEWNQLREDLTQGDFGVYLDSVASALIRGGDQDLFAEALAQVLAHEIGHCLGLYHVMGPRDLVLSPGMSRENVRVPRWTAAEQAYFDRILGRKR